MNAFRDACGATGPLVLAVEAPGGTAADTHVFEPPFVLIGSDPGCDLRLDHPEISPRHAYLQVVGGRVVCHDLGSRSGVSQGGRRGRVLDLTPDRPLRLGPFRLRLIGGDGPEAPPAPPEVEGEPVVLELSHRGLRTARHTLTPGLTLAGSGDVPLRLVDPSVSSHHAGFVLTPGGLWVVDLLGQGGIQVNGTNRSDARLEPGDTVGIGMSTVRRVAVPGVGGIPERPAQPAAAPAFAPRPAAEVVAAPPPPRPAPRVGISLAVVTSSPAGPPVAEAIAPLPASPPAPAPAAVPSAAVEGPPALAAAAPPAELVERMMAPVVHEFGRLQQRLVDEFHAARREMMEHVTRLYEERAAALDRELDSLRRLGAELTVLRDELQRSTPPAPVLPPLPPGLTVQIAPNAPTSTAMPMPMPMPTSPPIMASAAAGSGRLGSAASAGPRPPAGLFMSTFEPVGVEASASSMRVNGGRYADPPAASPTAPPNGHSPTPTPRLPLPEARAARLEEDLEAMSHLALTDPPPPPAGAATNDEIHARLCDRISQIQDHPPGLLRRMLGRLGSRSPR